MGEEIYQTGTKSPRFDSAQTKSFNAVLLLLGVTPSARHIFPEFFRVDLTRNIRQGILTFISSAEDVWEII